MLIFKISKDDKTKTRPVGAGFCFVYKERYNGCMTKFYTKKGDDGCVVIGEKKLPKDDMVFDLLGELDYINSFLGLCRAETKNKMEDISKLLKKTQELMFIAQAEIAGVGFGLDGSKSPKITASHTEFLEKEIEKIDGKVPEILHFIIPGATELSARIDVVRAGIRKIERLAVLFSKEKNISPEFLMFINRLSSFLFALARYVNYLSGAVEEKPEYKI